MIVWAFVLLFFLPSFGGGIRVQFEFATEEACQRLQKVVLRELRHMKVEVEHDCRPRLVGAE